MLIPFWTLRQVSHFTEFGLLLTQRLEERRWQRVQTWSKGWWCSLWILLPGWPLAPVLMCGGRCLCCQLGPPAWQRSSISQLHLDNMLQTLITSHLPSVSTWIKSYLLSDYRLPIVFTMLQFSFSLIAQHSTVSNFAEPASHLKPLFLMNTAEHNNPLPEMTPI